MRFQCREELNEMMAVPYETPGDPKRRYFNLKERPELIEEIPELKDIPELKQLVRHLNQKDSKFHTTGCEKSFDKSKGLRWKYGRTSYVTIIFEDRDANFNLGNFQDLCSQFQKYREQRGENYSDATFVEFIVERCSLNGQLGYTLCVWAHGYGNTKEKAITNWRKGVKFVEEFFRDQNLKGANSSAVEVHP